MNFAYATDGNLFVIADLPPFAPAADQVAVEIGGQTYDAGACHRRSGDTLLVARPIGGRLKAGSPIRIRISDLPAIETKLSRDAAAFRAALAPHEATLRALLAQAGRQDAYALEATAWPEMAAREEKTTLAQLGPELLLEVETCFVPVPGALVLVAWLDDPASVITSIDLFHGDGDIPFERSLLWFERPDGPPSQARRLRPSGCVAIVVPFDEAIVPDDDFVLMIATADGLWTRSLRPRGRLERGLGILEGVLPRHEANVQITILEQIAAIIAARPDAGATRAVLQALLSVAIAQLPEDITRGDLGVRVALDLACTVGTAGVFLLGWALLEPGAVRSIAFRTAAGSHHEIFADWVMHARLDVFKRLRDQAVHARSDRLGFLCFVPMPTDPEMGTGYLTLRWRDDRTFRMRVTLYFSAEDPLDAIKPVLTSFAQTHHDLKILLDRHVGPAIATVWKNRRGRATGIDVTRYGAPVEKPTVSVVIPLYGRFDFLEFQMANFADDPGMRGQDLIYVVDDPLIYDEARLLAQDCFHIYGVPFRLVYGRRNLGFAGATNLGASLARGEFILMMNSDVLPRRADWLPDLTTACRSLPDAGAVSPVLLYDDGSVQHAGMVFSRYSLWADMWVNEHPGKGLPKLPMTAPFECIAVTGACLMMSARIWRELGGLSDEFIIGDFEDSDLCMRLRAMGLRNWVVPAVELTHLERQSQDLIGDAAWRTNLSLFNCWTHHRKWDAAISAAQGG